MTILETQGLAARNAARVLAVAGTAKKDEALEAIAAALEANASRVLEANAADLEEARENGMRPSLLDRLALDEGRIAGIVAGVRQVKSLPDPIGVTTKMYTRPNGLTIGKRRVPLGVIGIIYEARPNVTVDAAALCLKSGNPVILRGGKEAFHSSSAMVAVMRDALESVGLPRDCIALVCDTSRETAAQLMNLTEYLDVLIPRGGAGLIRSVVENARVPVIQTGTGICHIFVDADADLDMAARILYNAKCSRPSVCNAVECLLLQEDAAADFLAKAVPLLDKHQVELRCDEKALQIVGTRGVPAAESDWDAEYDDYILAVRTVKDMEEAITFINAHGTGHSEAIITKNYFKAQHFLDQVDAAAVYVNASTRFTDGGEFGLGAEIGISTQKMHARGPMGLEELTSCKYVIYGEGQVR